MFSLPFLGFPVLGDVNLNPLILGTGKLFKAAVPIPEKEEIVIGREVAATLVGRYGLHDDPARTEYIALVGQVLAEQSDRPTLPFHFGILKTDEINAFAAPGGYILVTEGLLALLRDEAELAGVLGHEITHVTERHVLKEIQKSNLLSAGVDFASAKAKNPEILNQLGDASMLVLFKGLSRKDELKSDKAGMALAAQAGYDPQALLDVLQRLQSEPAHSTRLSTLLKTHPQPSERLASLRKALKELEKNRRGDTPLPNTRLAGRFQAVMSQPTH